MIKFSLSTCSFMACAFGAKSNKSLSNSKVTNTSFYVFFYKSNSYRFYNLVYDIFWVHLFICCKMFEVHFFSCRYPSCLSIFVKKIMLLPVNWFCTFVKNQLSIYVEVYFWILYLVNSFICLVLSQCHNVFITVILQ